MPKSSTVAVFTALSGLLFSLVTTVPAARSQQSGTAQNQNAASVPLWNSPSIPPQGTATIFRPGASPRYLWNLGCFRSRNSAQWG